MSSQHRTFSLCTLDAAARDVDMIVFNEDGSDPNIDHSYVAKTAARAKCEETGLWLFHSSRTLEKMYIKSVIIEHKAQTKQ